MSCSDIVMVDRGNWRRHKVLSCVWYVCDIVFPGNQFGGDGDAKQKKLTGRQKDCVPFRRTRARLEKSFRAIRAGLSYTAALGAMGKFWIIFLCKDQKFLGPKTWDVGSGQ